MIADNEKKYKKVKKNLELRKKVVTLHQKSNNNDMATLKNKVEIYVPSTYDGNKPARIMQAFKVKKIAKALAAMFGGATATRAEGYYVSDTKGLIKERQMIVFACCDDEGLIQYTEQVKNLAAGLRDEMKQESITITINGEMSFI